MRELFHHVCDVIEENGRFRPTRFTDWQIDRLYEIHKDYGDNASGVAGASIMFYTTASEISFNYKCKLKFNLASGFDIYENGRMITTQTLPIEDCEGVFTYKKKNEGETLIEIFLPGNAEGEYWNFNLGEFKTMSSAGKKLIVYYGDSLTQSAYVRTPSLNFAQITSRMLDADFVNRGIGSLYYNASYLDENDTLKPDVVMVQFGANDLVARDEKNDVVVIDGVAQFRTVKDLDFIIANARAYLTRIKEIYPKAKICVTTCIYKDYIPEDTTRELAIALSGALRSLAKELEITLIEGDGLLPALDECRVEDKIHFTALGGALVAINLAKYLK